MTDSSRSTIFALSSGRGPAAIAVIRISGPRAGAALMALGVKIPEPRKASLARIRDAATGEIIDEALVLWFPAPHSETGEDVAELQAHGGRAVIAAILDALARVDGLRMAEAGEFPRRGFENGKLDLTAVEGLVDLLSAETEGQRRQAYRQMKGLLGDRAEAWRKKLIQALALVEACIDFSDEADVQNSAQGNLVQPALAIVRELADEIAAALADGGRGERLREGLVVAIAGPPNAGKSTLLNRIAKREAAIVSPYPGTTRDVIEVHLDLGGLSVTLLDTAGIRETDDPVELEGVRRARERAAGADLVLWVVDASAEQGGQLESAGGSMADLLADSSGPAGAAKLPNLETGNGRIGTVSAPSCRPLVWRIRNKIDLINQEDSKNELKLSNISSSEHKTSFNKPLKNIVKKELPGKNELKFRTKRPIGQVVGQGLINSSESISNDNGLQFDISAASGEGFDQILQHLRGYAEAYLAGSEQALITRARHRRAFEETVNALNRALADQLVGHEDLLAEELRGGANALGRLTGRVDVEDILDVIFRDFCIGK